MKPVHMEPKVLEAFAGSYKLGQDFFIPGVVVTLEGRNDYLLMKWSSGAESVLVPVGENEFLDRNFWARIRFTRGKDGEITGLIYSSGKDYTAPKLLH